MRVLSFILLFYSSFIHASLKEAAILFGKGRPRLSQLDDIIVNTVNAGFPFSALPWTKEYIVSRGVMSTSMNSALEEIIDQTGVRQFQVLPLELLNRVKSSSVHFVVAKKYFARGKFNLALKALELVKPGSKVFPFASHMTAAIHSIENRQELATEIFKECVRTSERAASYEKNKIKMKQYQMNKDYCLTGLARAQFARRNFKKADLAYLDIQKQSQVWPEILFEEAWNSFYLGNYNRTLGKLVTYKAPVLDHFFKPEADVLVALSYLKLCLYDDAKKTVDDFYSQYLKSSRALRKLLKARRQFSYYYDLATETERMSTTRGGLLGRVIESIVMEQAYKEIKEGLRLAEIELKSVLKIPGNSRFKRALVNNIKEVIRTQKVILGSYVRNRAIAKYAELYRAFQDMSYIKLEVLGQRKKSLYASNSATTGKRGSFEYIETNDKQYFWNFNGEFWADELGDYVFALASRCRN